MLFGKATEWVCVTAMECARQFSRFFFDFHPGMLIISELRRSVGVARFSASFSRRPVRDISQIFEFYLFTVEFLKCVIRWSSFQLDMNGQPSGNWPITSTWIGLYSSTLPIGSLESLIDGNSRYYYWYISEVSSTAPLISILNPRTMFSYASGILVYGLTWIMLGNDGGEKLSPNSWKEFTVS